MIHVISPIFHEESNGDNFMNLQLPQGVLGYPFEQQHGGGDDQ